MWIWFHRNFVGLEREGLIRLNDLSRVALTTGQGPDGFGTPVEFVTSGVSRIPQGEPSPARGPVRLLRELLEDFEKLKGAKKKETTVKAMALPLRFIREIIGEDTPLDGIHRDHLREVAEAVIAYPKNAVQNYPRLSIRDAISAGKKDAATGREAKTLRNNWIHIVSVFNYAVANEWMEKNPIKGSWFDDQFPKESVHQR